MDPANLDCIASEGVVLSVAHKAALQSSLPVLKKNNKFSKVLLFGKVMGKTGDYLIAIGISESYLGPKKFFYCQDGVSWAQLPAVTADMKATAMKLPMGLAFTGDISAEIQLPAPPVLEGEDEVEGPKITEEQRLAVFAEMVEAETALAPVGALSMLSTGAVVASPTFMGLDAADAMLTKSYVLLNKPKVASVLEAPLTKSLDALASAETVVPKAALRVFSDESVGATKVRSLLYPGAISFCKPGTPVWGYCYFGTGEMNVDIAFMLP